MAQALPVPNVGVFLVFLRLQFFNYELVSSKQNYYCQIIVDLGIIYHVKLCLLLSLLLNCIFYNSALFPN